MQQAQTAVDPPMSSLASERMLIYAALSESKNNIFPSLASTVRSEDFIEEAHQAVWRKRISLEESGLAHDLVSMVTSLQRTKAYFGGLEYLMAIVRDDLHANISTVALQAAAVRVHEQAGLRAITKTMKEAIQMAETGLLGRDGVVNMVGDAVDVIRSERNAHASSATHIREFVGLALEQIETRASGVIPDNLTTTGFPEQDQILSGGFADGDLIVLAARPSMGKTAISLAFAEAAAAKDRAVFYASTEQSGLALTYRSLASASRINATKLREADLQDDDYARLVDGAQKVGELDIFIDETSSLSLPDLCNRIRAFATDVRQRTGKKILVVVDYLQRLQAHRNAERAVILGEITTGLKNLAKEIGCPIVLLAQLNRKVEERTSKRPMMSDLAESGKIEQDADVIMFLYRDEYYNPATKEPGITEVITGKNRDGKVGIVKLAFQADQLRYSSLAFGGSTDF